MKVSFEKKLLGRYDRKILVLALDFDWQETCKQLVMTTMLM